MDREAVFAIRVENLSKQYRIGGPQGRYKYKSLREELIKVAQAPFRRLSSVLRGQSSTISNETIWALKGVSFEVQRGEVVGIPSAALRAGVGRNGVGEHLPERRYPFDRIERKFEDLSRR